MSKPITTGRGKHIVRSLSFLIILILILPGIVFSQTSGNQNGKAPDRTLHHEVKNDDYIPLTRDSQERSPGYRYSMSNVTTVRT